MPTSDTNPAQPAPLIPPDADLRGFTFVPLDVGEIRDSALAAHPFAEPFRCAILARAAAWHQRPAGSLPAEDHALARLTGYARDVRAFRKAWDAGGGSGWHLHSDGRYYHDELTGHVLNAWSKSQKARRAGAIGGQSRASASRPPETAQAIDNAEHEGKRTPDERFETADRPLSNQREGKEREEKGREENRIVRPDAFNPPSKPEADEPPARNGELIPALLVECRAAARMKTKAMPRGSNIANLTDMATIEKWLTAGLPSHAEGSGFVDVLKQLASGRGYRAPMRLQGLDSAVRHMCAPRQRGNNVAKFPVAKAK